MSKRVFRPEYRELMTNVHPMQFRFGDDNARHKVTYRGISGRVDEVIAGMEAGQYGLVGAGKNFDLVAAAGRISKKEHVPVIILHVNLAAPLTTTDEEEDTPRTPVYTYQIINYLDDDGEDTKSRVNTANGFKFTDNMGVMECYPMHGIRNLIQSGAGLPVILTDLRGADIQHFLDASTAINDISHGFGSSALTLIDAAPHGGIAWAYNAVVRYRGDDDRRAYWKKDNYNYIKPYQPFRVIW